MEVEIGANEDQEAEPEPTGEDMPSEVEHPDDPGKEPETTTLYSTASLNVRSGRGTSHPVVAGLTYGEPVEAGNLESGWYELFSDGHSIGFALADYLSAERPPERPKEAMPRASRDMGLFAVGLPTGSALIESVPLTEDADARQEYRVPMSASEIRTFFARELDSLGWKPHVAQSDTAISYRKGDLELTVDIDRSGQRFTLTGGRR